LRIILLAVWAVERKRESEVGQENSESLSSLSTSVAITNETSGKRERRTHRFAIIQHVSRARVVEESVEAVLSEVEIFPALWDLIPCYPLPEILFQNTIFRLLHSNVDYFKLDHLPDFFRYAWDAVGTPLNRESTFPSSRTNQIDCEKRFLVCLVRVGSEAETGELDKYSVEECRFGCAHPCLLEDCREERERRCLCEEKSVERIQQSIACSLAEPYTEG